MKITIVWMKLKPNFVGLTGFRGVVDDILVHMKMTMRSMQNMFSRYSVPSNIWQLASLTVSFPGFII